MPKNQVHNDLLKKLVEKMSKCTLPSTIQGISLLFARYFSKSFDEMLGYLNLLVINNTKQGLKIVMDRWLLHQPRFIGKLTKNVTYQALMQIFASRNQIFETLLVLGYDPSHTKDSPEVYTPLKILSTLIRCFDNEKKTTNKDTKVLLVTYKGI